MKRRLISVVVSIVLTLCAIPLNLFSASAICCCKDGFDKTKYTLNGDMAKDVATIAKSQNGRSQSQIGYTEGWCDEFVADCIENAGGGSDIVGHGGTVGDFLNVMKKKGATEVSTPQAGDLVFYYRESTKSYPHVAIMLDSTNSAHGNIWLNGYGQVYCMSYKSYGDGNGNKVGSGLKAVFVRPAYKGTTTTVKFYRNLNKDDTKSVTETFTTGISNQKFGYKPDGTARYSPMNDASVGFGQWSNSGCKMLGWSTDRNATTASWKTYSSVVDSWIAKNAPSINLYAVWEQSLSSIEIDTQPTYKIYPQNGKIDTTGLVLKAIFSDGSTQKITEEFTVNADLSTIGKTKATVSYGGKTVTYDVEVKNYFDGDGTETSPYLIKSKSDLNTLASVVNNVAISNSYKQAYYKQTADIDLENEEFTPIGIFYSSETGSLVNEIAFDGIYNGGKHSIINLSVNWDSKYSGLFGRTQRHSAIKDLSVYGNVTGNGSCTGGIVGEVGYGGKVLNCSFNGTVTGENLVGGITSSLQGGGTVSCCYANAEVKAKSSVDTAWAGGIVGRPHVGHASNSENAEVSNCYFVGSVSGEVTGGIVGKTVIETTKNNTVTYSNNYFLKSDELSASGDESVASNDGRALSEELMKNASEILGTPFALNWSNNLNDGYPVFEWQVILRGDANNDGEVNIADAVMLQKWLLGSGDLTNWQNVDLCEDGVIDVFDMVFMRKLIIEK